MSDIETLPGRPVRPDEIRLVYLGVLTKPQGIKGGIRMLPEFDDLDDFEDLKTDRLFLKVVNPPGSLKPRVPAGTTAYREVTLNEFFPHQRYLVLFLDGVTDMDTADRMRSLEVYVYEDEMWDLPDGQYYFYQLLGLEVYDTESGRVVGKVKQVQPGVQDYFVIETEGRDVLVPNVPEIVTRINIEGKRIECALPEGLLEI